MFKKYLISLFLTLVFANASAALQLEVDKDNLGSDEILTVVISTKDHIVSTPDLSPLRKDFRIVGTSRNTQISIHNGSTQIETEWQIALMPLRSGALTLPAIQIGSEKTEPRIIHVSNANAPNVVTPSQNSGVFLEASVLPKEIYIQEELVYRLKVYYSQAIENPYLSPPDLPDAKITLNGQDIVYSTVKNGKYYRVLERSYLITPKNTGRFQIQPPVLKGYVEDTNRMIDMYGFTNRSVRPVKVTGPVLEINVKPKPSTYTGQWLPAKKLTLSELWEPNQPTFREGEPVTRVIQVTAEGASGEQIPSINIGTSANLNSYPEPAQKETDANGEVQIGKLKQKIVFIPTSSGKVTFPAIKVHWWNINTQKEQVSILPPKTVNVLPAIKTTSKVSSATTNMTTNPIPVENKTEKIVEHSIKDYMWPFIAILFLLVWLVTVWMWRRQIKSGNRSSSRKGHSLSISDILNQLKEACFSNNAKQARRYFLSWAALYWKDPSLHSLSDIIHLLEQEKAGALTKAIMQLEATFYSRSNSNWNGSAFWYSLHEYIHSKEAGAAQTNSDLLPPLYFSS